MNEEVGGSPEVSMMKRGVAKRVTKLIDGGLGGCVCKAACAVCAVVNVSRQGPFRPGMMTVEIIARITVLVSTLTNESLSSC